MYIVRLIVWDAWHYFKWAMGTLANLLPNVLTRCGNTWKGYLRRKFLVRTPPALPKSQISVHTYLRHCKNSVPAAEEAEKKVGAWIVNTQ